MDVERIKIIVSVVACRAKSGKPSWKGAQL
jgi:hypothetical protein